MIISITSLTLSGLLLLFSFYIFYKIRCITGSLALAASIKPTNALPTNFPSFRFTFSPSPSTTELPNSPIPITDHACYSSNILVIFIVLTLAFLVYRFYKRKTKSAIYLEFNTPTKTILCKVMSLPSSRFLECHFTGTSYLDSVDVSGYIKPNLNINWGDFKVHHNSFSIPMSPPPKVSINPYEAYILRKIFNTQFMLSPRLIHLGYLTELKICDSSCLHKPSTTSSCIYPQLSG